MTFNRRRCLNNLSPRFIGLPPIARSFLSENHPPNVLVYCQRRTKALTKQCLALFLQTLASGPERSLRSSADLSLSLSLSLRRFCFFAPAQGRTYADVHERRPPSSSPKKETRPVYPIDLASGGSPYLRPIYRPIYRIPLHSAEVGLALGGDLLAPSRGEAKQTRSNGTERLRRGTERGGGTEGHQSPVNLLQHSFLVAGVGFCRVRLRL